MKLYLKSSGSGLSIVPKLKYEHVYLTSFSKMRVDLAAQVNIKHVMMSMWRCALSRILT